MKCIRSFLCSLLLAAPLFAQDPPEVDHGSLLSSAGKDELRTWTIRDGRKARGVLIDSSKDKILVEDGQGKKMRVPLRLLKDADLARARKWAPLVTTPAGFQADETVVIRTLFEQMKYDVERFTVMPGSKLRLLLINDDQMAHNLIVLKPGKDVGMDVAQKAWALGEAAMAKQWIPEDERILVHTRLVGGFLSQAIHFTAPSEPGEYPYICSIPGHVQTMKGVMTVSNRKPGLMSLDYAYYTGNWNKLPDWSSLTPVATGTLAKKQIEIGMRKTNDRFGFVFTGKLATPKKGKYTFHIGSDDGSSLDINGKRVVTNDGIHGVQYKSGSITLDEGIHDIKVAYFEGSGGEELHVGWDGPGFKQQPLSKGYRKSGGGGGGGAAGIPILVENDEASMYWNFIQGGGTRGIGVGYPGEVNLCFDADNLFISLIWLGDFMDGARHWKGRGQGFQPPAGHSVQKLVAGVPLAELSSPTTPWPDSTRKSNEVRPPAHFRFRGYKLNAQRYPSFRYSWKDLQVEDSSEPAEGLEPALKRTLRVKAASPHSNLYFRAAAGSISQNGSKYEVDGGYAIEIQGAPAQLRDTGGQQELLVKLPLQKGSAQFTQTYTWLNPEAGGE